MKSNGNKAKEGLIIKKCFIMINLNNCYDGWNLIEKIFREKDVQKVREIIKNYGFWKITWIRAIFVSFFDILSYACGLTEMSTEKFILSTIISNIPIIALVLVFGSKVNLNFVFMIWVSLGILI